MYSEMYLGKVGELSLKRSNIRVFEKQLVTNARTALETVDAKIHTQSGRLYVSCTTQSCQAVEYMLDRLIGITGWAKVVKTQKDIGAITDAVTELAKKARDAGAKTFKIDARREDKSFPLNSYQICTQAASGAFDSGILAVDVHKPDVVISVEVRDECFVYSTQKRTCRGLPVGVSGKGLLLLSGGLDSPVAGYRMMRRGMKVECVYFHSYPYTSEEAQKKVEDLAEVLSGYGCDTHLNIIPFTDVQMKIKAKSPQDYTTLMLRLCMMKCANMLAQRINAQCLITGESLGQVASQTMENMAVTESFAEYPLLRPLVGLDKEEITDTAIQIGSYDISILPYEDCCVLFSPRHPVLKANVEEAKKIYESLEVDQLVEEAFNNRKIIRYALRDTIGKKWATKPYRVQVGNVVQGNDVRSGNAEGAE
ncbi:MAG: tRNA 4-thiouridine(8) synthase ThiI [Treponema sp.]|nr:tRNA 4-thiouridine(8) synthase ThiI [Treponema sp.]